MGRAMTKYNPQPVFTETFRLFDPQNPGGPVYQLNSNAGGILTVAISQMPQVAQYKSLYTKYRILRAQFICLPQFVTESSDGNASAYNGSLGLQNMGMARIVTSVSDSPGSSGLPLSEDDVLEDNGCKIHTGKSKLVLTCRPVAETEDNLGTAMTLRGKYINFEASGPDIDHYGIRWWYTLPVPSGNITPVPYFVYCKLTFQLADPR